MTGIDRGPSRAAFSRSRCGPPSSTASWTGCRKRRNPSARRRSTHASWKLCLRRPLHRHARPRCPLRRHYRDGPPRMCPLRPNPRTWSTGQLDRPFRFLRPSRHTRNPRHRRPLRSLRPRPHPALPMPVRRRPLHRPPVVRPTRVPAHPEIQLPIRSSNRYLCCRMICASMPIRPWPWPASPFIRTARSRSRSSDPPRTRD